MIITYMHFENNGISLDAGMPEYNGSSFWMTQNSSKVPRKMGQWDGNTNDKQIFQQFKFLSMFRSQYLLESSGRVQSVPMLCKAAHTLLLPQVMNRFITHRRPYHIKIYRQLKHSVFLSFNLHVLKDVSASEPIRGKH
jgi:hypothetical protein